MALIGAILIIRDWDGPDPIGDKTMQAKLIIDTWGMDAGVETTRINQIAIQAGDLPPLTGSPKQIAWADTIRAQSINALEEHLHDKMGGHRVVSRDEVSKIQTSLDAVIARFFAKIVTKTESKWWIDKKDAMKKNSVARAF